MLDAETKNKIDSARDILVGKVPDPKSQVEQITIALIYKFMDDMDRKSEEIGGKATFFVGEFQKYRWSQLLDMRLSGHERLLLYAEGLEKMNENKSIPQLFRDIFKGVFLPYRDPETLNLFLKEINGFTYDHSERLGDAFEYILSVLGTQGDAGQFRTPRHIIDFIVAIIDPQKSETVLDPACGTAGFLISAYKHIMKANDNLTPDERARLMSNFRGYDIAPDMVRLSRVNMYLHGFQNPTIYEYDTLTSEERWDERCDVIMANPPFMTPKGGIRPHNRFSIRANRSEVLFVDYIAEHLNPSGRAGIIVPEGIIFQSQNAYKALRKMLIENHLWAVVSLPAGVFHPYSGVKTSILLLDKNLAKRTDEVIFIKIENDGFDLGAQRRPIEGGNFPEALKVLIDYKDRRKVVTGKMVLTVSRSRLLESTDINLSGDRYRVAVVRPTGKWPLVELGEICEITKGSPITKKEAVFGPIPVIAGGQQPAYYHNMANRFDETITVSASGAYAGFVNFFQTPIFASDCSTIVPKNKKAILPLYIYHIMKGRQEDIYKLQQGGGQPHVYPDDLREMKIPLPPIEEQERIVSELEGYRKIIEGARQIITNYKPNVRTNPKWPMVRIGDLCLIERGASPRPIHDFITDSPNGVNWIKIGDAPVGSKFITKTKERITQEGAAKSRAVKPGDFILSNSMSFGRPYIMAIEGCIHDGWLLLRITSDSLDNDFLYAILGSNIVIAQFERSATGGVVNNLNSELVRNVTIPIPPRDIQRQIVEELEIERKMVVANQDLIVRMETKIQAKLSEIWHES